MVLKRVLNPESQPTRRDKACPTAQVFEHGHIGEPSVTVEYCLHLPRGGVIMFQADHSPGLEQDVDEVDLSLIHI